MSHLTDCKVKLSWMSHNTEQNQLSLLPSALNQLLTWNAKPDGDFSPIQLNAIHDDNVPHIDYLDSCLK